MSEATLQQRLDEEPLNSAGILWAGHDLSAVITRDVRVYGDGAPWWGPSRIDACEVGACRVTLERLCCGGLWLRNCYLSTVRDTLCLEGGLRIGPDAADAPASYPSAITLVGVHVRQGGLRIHAANINWTGGSVERSPTPLEISSGTDTGAIVLTGVRFEHDDKNKLTLGGPSPITLVGCHFTMTDVIITADAHPDTKLIGCSFVASKVTDKRKSWWMSWSSVAI